jgi:hypothetical protein
MSASVRSELTPVRNSVERFFLAWFFVLIPALYVLRLAVEYVAYGDPYALRDTVKIAAEIALLIMLTFANIFLATIGPTLAALTSNGVVSHSTPEGGEVAAMQTVCEQAIDRRLNHDARIVVAAGVALVTLYYYVTHMGGSSALVPTSSFLRGLDVMLYFLPTVCYTYFVGVVGWKLLVTSLFFQSFPERYAVIPRFLHPDGACGLLPVGDLCLRMMYVAVTPTVLSALLLAAQFAPQGFLGYLIPNPTLLFRFTPLILGVGVIGLVVGFLPLFKFHLAIIRHRHEWTGELNGLAERIIAEKAKVLGPSESLQGTSIDAVLKTVTELQSHYEASRKVRMWPVDGRLVTRIWGSVGILGGQLLAFLEAVRKIA